MNEDPDGMKLAPQPIRFNTAVVTVQPDTRRFFVQYNFGGMKWKKKFTVYVLCALS